MLLFLAFLCLCFGAARECYVVSCKPYFYFWEACKCVRHTKNPIALTVMDEKLADDFDSYSYEYQSQCVVFNYKQKTTSIETDGGNELVMHTVIVQAVQIDDDQGRNYPPHIFNIHRISMSDTDRNEVIAIAQEKFPMGKVEYCYPEVADDTEEQRLIEGFIGADF